MKKSLYMGVLHSYLPDKRYGFIKPLWSTGKSNDNIFFSRMDISLGKCFIKTLGDPEKREELTLKKGDKIYFPTEEEVLYFNLEVVKHKKDNAFKAFGLRDANHVTDQEAEEAESNSEVRPSFEEVEYPAKEEVDLTVNPTVVAPTTKICDDKAELEEEEQPLKDGQVRVKVTTSLADLEKALFSSQANNEKSTKKAVKDGKKKEKGPKEIPTECLAIYTDEELAELEEEEDLEIESDSEDVDYDEYDEYYDEK